jgi:hypothetical protein
MSSGKGGSQSNDYYGHVAGIACCGPLDFIAGFMIDNDVVWPKAKSWDSQIHQKNKKVIYIDGNVYKTPAATDVDPPTAPWALYAIPWAAGTTLAGDKKLYLGNVWKAAVNTATNPPATAPAPIAAGNTQPRLGVQQDVATGDWIYDCTPPAWSGATHFWASNSIVAHNGQLWINSADTNKEPGLDPVWTLWKQDLTGGPNPYKFTVENHGDVFLYLGTGTQTLDTVDEQILNALGHPPYRHRAVVMLKNFLLGSSTTTPPNVTLIGGRKPVQTLIIDNTGVVGVDATAFDDDWQVNPWCVLAELLTNPVWGLGLPNAWFDATTWQAEADRCAAHPELHYISPLYTSLKKVREIVADIMGYPDAFIFWSSIATLTAGHWPHHEAAPAFTAATTIDRNDIIEGEELETTSDGWSGTLNAVAVSFRDIEAGFTNRPALAPNLFNRTITQRLTVQKIERPHIVRLSQALAWATEFAKIAGDQTFACSSLTVRAEKAASINQGDIFLLTDDQLGFSQPMRCTKKTIAAAGIGRVMLQCELERGVAPQPYAPTPTKTAPPSGPPPATIANYAAVQLPSALAGQPNTIAVLAGRENESTASLEIWFRGDDGASFQQLGSSRGFAVPGVLSIHANNEGVYSGGDSVTLVNVGAVTQGNTYNLGKTDFWKNQVFYSVNISGIPHSTATEGVDYTLDQSTGELTIITGGAIPTGYYVNVKLWQNLVVRYNTSAPQADIDTITTVPTQDEIDDGQILLFAFQVANPALFEIMSVRSVTAAGSDLIGPVFFVQVLRSQFNSTFGGDGSYVWGTNPNDVIMMIRKSDLAPLTHENFPFYHANSSTIHLRLAPASAWVQADITDLFDAAGNPNGLTTAFDYTFNNIYAPTVTWGQLLRDSGSGFADITDFTVTFASTDVFNFSFELDSREGNLAHGALVAVQGQQEITLWSTNMTPASPYNKTVQFQLPTGNWSIEIRALDDSGNQITSQLTYSGSPVLMHVNSATAAAPIIYSYHDSGGYRNDLLFGLLPGVAANFHVYYQIQNRNVDFNPASWIAATVSGGAIGGLYRWGSPPPIKKGSSGQTLYAYCTQTGKTDSDVVKWNF